MRGVRWMLAELDVLHEHFATGGVKACKALLPGRTEAAISQRANAGGLHYCTGRGWTPSEVRILLDHYPTMGTAVAEMLPGRTRALVKAKVKKMGLRTQTPRRGHLTALRQQLAAAIQERDAARAELAELRALLP